MNFELNKIEIINHYLISNHHELKKTYTFKIMHCMKSFIVLI